MADYMQWIQQGIQVGMGLYAQGQANKAEDDIVEHKGDLDSLLDERVAAFNPATGMNAFQATDVTGNLHNPYDSLRVATKAAELQMEQTDIALANTLDTLRISGMGAGGATALAQAAAQGKAGIAANIEQQESQNDRLRAQGEMQLQGMKLQDAQRVQGIAASEHARIQGLQFQGAQWEWAANEDRLNADLDRAQALLDNEGANKQNWANQAFGMFGQLAGSFGGGGDEKSGGGSGNTTNYFGGGGGGGGATGYDPNWTGGTVNLGGGSSMLNNP